MTDYKSPDEITEDELPDPQLEVFTSDRADIQGSTVSMEYPEFRHVCPASGRPDHGTLSIEYKVGTEVVEEKSLRDYLFKFADKGAWHTSIINAIADEIMEATDCKWVEVSCEFAPRGGIFTEETTCKYRDDRIGEEMKQ